MRHRFLIAFEEDPGKATSQTVTQDAHNSLVSVGVMNWIQALDSKAHQRLPLSGWRDDIHPLDFDVIEPVSGWRDTVCRTRGLQLATYRAPH